MLDAIQTQLNSFDVAANGGCRNIQFLSETTFKSGQFSRESTLKTREILLRRHLPAHRGHVVAQFLDGAGDEANQIVVRLRH